MAIRLCAFADEASNMIDGQIAAMKRNGIELLEIRGVDGENIKDITRDKAKEVRKKLDDAGLSVWSMGSPIGKITTSDDLDEHIEAHKRIMEYADVLGTKRIRMFSFLNFKENPLSWDEFESKAFPMMQRLCDATPSDFILCHENEKRIFGENPENCVKLLREFPKLRAVFDPANFVQCGVDTLKAWDMLKSYVDYMHIKDANAQGKVVPAGYGIGNVGEIVKMYLAQGGEVMTLEPHLNSFVGLDKLEDGESLATAFSYKDNDESFDAAVKALRAII